MKYSYIIHTPSGNITAAEQVNPFEAGEAEFITVAPFDVQITSQEKGGCCLTEVTVSADTSQQVYVSVYGEGDAEYYSFAKLCEDERLFRQSPHNPDNCYFKMEKAS